MIGKNFFGAFIFLNTLFFAVGRIRYIIRNKDGEQALELYLNSNGKQVYKDSGSLAYTDLGIWDPSNETGWLMAGQKAQPSHGGLSSSIVMVKELRSNKNLLVEPNDFEKIWDDKGSIARGRVAVWEMVCPQNYRWLSHIAHGCDDCSWTKPSWYKTRLRCVHESMVDECTLEKTPLWTNRGDTADKKVSFWKYDTKVENRFSGYYMTREGTYDEPPTYNKKAYCFKQHEEIEEDF